MPLGAPGEGREATLISKTPTPNMALISPRSSIGPRAGDRDDEQTSVDDVFFFLFFFFYRLINKKIVFFFFFFLLSPDHRQRIGWGAISTALHMKYINILYNSLKYCIVYIRHIK